MVDKVLVCNVSKDGILLVLKWMLKGCAKKRRIYGWNERGIIEFVVGEVDDEYLFCFFACVCSVDVMLWFNIVTNDIDEYGCGYDCFWIEMLLIWIYDDWLIRRVDLVCTILVRCIVVWLPIIILVWVYCVVECGFLWCCFVLYCSVVLVWDVGCGMYTVCCWYGGVGGVDVGWGGGGVVIAGWWCGVGWHGYCVGG